MGGGGKGSGSTSSSSLLMMMKESGSGGRRLQAVGEGVNLGDSGGGSTMVGMADKGDDTVHANCEYAS